MRGPTYKLGPQRTEAGLDKSEPQDVVGNTSKPEALHVACLLAEADD